MRIPTHAEAFQVLLLQAADEGRGVSLFGSSLERVRKWACPFMVGNEFPSVYLEFPLAGESFLDVSVLLGSISPGTRIDSDAAMGTDAMLDWYASVRPRHIDVCCGFELDAKQAVLPSAGVHFQPRSHTKLVAPFCSTIGEEEKGELYLAQSRRMPTGWPLSFFGLFRGREGSPLRICGYLSTAEQSACATDPQRIARVFDKLGFSAYDDTMLAQVSELMGRSPATVDFQFDLFPDGSLSEVFAIDVQLNRATPEVMRASFENGACANVMRTLEEWGAADERWHLVADATFARSIPVELDDGERGLYAFTLMPQWAKARWIDGRLQPAKLYHHIHGGLIRKRAS